MFVLYHQEDKVTGPPKQQAPLPPCRPLLMSSSSNDIRRIQSTSGKLYRQPPEQEFLQRKTLSSIKRANTFASPGTVDEAGYTQVMLTLSGCQARQFPLGA